ncbi:MAG: c-type cytochrome [candidate division Zixibacteria bacterium]|nr:c-type cytochrome [candidate division Zixibacteria bacterium]
MKKATALMVLVLFLGLIVYAFAQKEEAEKMVAPDPAAELAKSVANGKKLFNDKTLGTADMTCNSCHMEGGTKEGKMGETVIPAWDNLAPKYPKYFAMGKRVMTLDQVVQFCIVNPLKGKALAWDDQKLTDLTAYCASVKKAPKKEEK